MMAMVLTIGVVVDDSIVVLENIYRHIEEGQKPMQAAIEGMKEIVFCGDRNYLITGSRISSYGAADQPDRTPLH